MSLLFRWIVLAVLSLGYSSISFSLDVLTPVKTDSPQDTLKTFMDAMNNYRMGVKNNSAEQKKSIDRAIRTLNLSSLGPLLQDEMGRKAAIFLKEVIDRVVVIDYSRVPPGAKAAPFNGKYWRLKDTEIVIRLVEEGPRSGEFLFSVDTVERAKSFYELVKDYPYLKGSGMGAGYQEDIIASYLPKSLKGEVIGIPRWQIIGIFIALVLGFIVKMLVEALLSVGKLVVKKSSFDWDNKFLHAVEGPIAYCAASGFWFLSLYVLRLEGALLQGLTLFVQVVFSLSVIWIFYRLADVWAEYLAIIAKRSDLALDDQIVQLINRALRSFILIFGILIAIQNLGINVMSVVAGLGLGGLAFALAAKDTAANLFGSIMILWDRPFKVGDIISFDAVEGTVEDLGFRSTRVRTYYNSLITVPNAVVANANIDNLGKRRLRRLKTTLGVTYDTPALKLEAFLEGIRNILMANPYVDQDSFHVVFNNYGASSLDILINCHLEVPDWGAELRQKQSIFFEILRLAKHIGIDFAFPTQSLHVESFPEKSPLVRHNENYGDQQLAALAADFAKGGSQSKPEGLGLYKGKTTP